MKITKKIRVLILDIGGVLIRWYIMVWCAALARRFETSSEEILRLWHVPTDFSPPGIFTQFSSGQLREEDLLRLLNTRFGTYISQQEFRELWRNEGDHSADFEVINHVRAVAQHHRLVVISCTNVDPILADHYRNPGEALYGLFHYEVKSCDPEVRSVKPGPRMFEVSSALAKKHGGAEPDQCLFADDKLENVVAARSHGFHAIHYTSPPLFMTALDAHGLFVPRAP